MRNKIIVFGGNHYNTLGLIRSVGIAGYKVTVLLQPCNLKFCELRFSKYIEKIYFLKETEEALEILRKEFVTETLKPIILCASDSAISLLDSNLNELSKSFYFFNANNTQGEINRLMDKANTFPVAAECGFSIIKTWCVNGSNNIPSDVTFPCIIKGQNSNTSSKSDIAICYDYKELKSALRNGIDYLVQEYIVKDYELCIVGVSAAHGKSIQIAGAVRKIRETLEIQSTYIRLDSFEKYPKFDVSVIKKLVKGLGYEGIFSVEVLAKGNKYYFLEINLRNDATSWIYTSAGINYPLHWVEACSEIVSEYENLNVIEKSRYLIQLSDFGHVVKKHVGIGKWLKQAITADSHFIFNIKDIKPFLYQIYIPFRQVIKKIIKC